MKFMQLENMLQDEGIIFLSYGGALTQPLISGMTDALEKEVASNDLDMTISNNIFTIFIELSQNMLNYATKHPEITEAGLIIVGMKPDEDSYYILSRNKIADDAKEIIESRFQEIEGLTKEELRTLYRKKRKIKKQDNSNSAGIGFIEIARKCDKIQHKYDVCKDGSLCFTVTVTIHK